MKKMLLKKIMIGRFNKNNMEDLLGMEEASTSEMGDAIISKLQ